MGHPGGVQVSPQAASSDTDTRRLKVSVASTCFWARLIVAPLVQLFVNNTKTADTA